MYSFKKMTKHECRMSKEIRMTKHEERRRSPLFRQLPDHSDFVILLLVLVLEWVHSFEHQSDDAEEGDLAAAISRTFPFFVKQLTNLSIFPTNRPSCRANLREKEVTYEKRNSFHIFRIIFDRAASRAEHRRGGRDPHEPGRWP
jgi:hypothetical protein